ncbi:MAG: folate-binding protein [Rhodoferax sp.]|nr:folate-binding protein [Rhodoferax sp.]
MNGVATLKDLGVIQIEGDDAAKFIHGQLTQDFVLLDQASARLAAFCNAKGRMQASMIGFKRPAGLIFLICRKDLLAATLKRLSMFVLRAKARLSDVSEQFDVYGVAGDASVFPTESTPKPWQKFETGSATVVQLYPAQGLARQLWLTPVGSPAPRGPTLDVEVWNWSEVRSGIATLNAAVFEAFVPQMLNYESVGGVNFKKGCYPGQEVVARSQFRGTLKRRAFVVHAESSMTAGTELFAATDPERAVGIVVQSAPNPQGGHDAIASIQLSAIAEAPLNLGRADGPPVSLLPLPYPLLEDI